MWLCVCVCVCVYIYIYRERERERGADGAEALPYFNRHCKWL